MAVAEIKRCFPAAYRSSRPLRRGSSSPSCWTSPKGQTWFGVRPWHLWDQVACLCACPTPSKNSPLKFLLPASHGRRVVAQSLRLRAAAAADTRRDRTLVSLSASGLLLYDTAPIWPECSMSTSQRSELNVETSLSRRLSKCNPINSLIHFFPPSE